MLSTFGHRPGPPQMGLGPLLATRTPRRWVRDLHFHSDPPQMGPGHPRAHPDPCELSAQLAARKGSGTATCHADAGAGTSLPLEAPSPTRIKCEWLRRALLRLGTGSFCQSTLWIASYRGGSSVTEARSSVSALHA